MNSECVQIFCKYRKALTIRYMVAIFAPRAYSVIIFGALFCTMLAKFVHSLRYDLLNEYFGWILVDVYFLLTIELVLAIICFRWPRKLLIRIVTIIAAIVCTWSVMNAGWLLRTGTQILPRVLLPLIRSPLNSLNIIGVNLMAMPKTAFFLLMPSAVALAFFFYVLTKPQIPAYNRRNFMKKVFISGFLVIVVILAQQVVSKHRSPQVASLGLHHNCHIQAIVSLFSSNDYRPLEPKRNVPSFDQSSIALKTQQVNHNVVLVILEGIQYMYTSLANGSNNLTPYLARLSNQGVEFTNARSSLTHTTKALFALLTGRYPSISQDIAEAVPLVKPYASIATILRTRLNYRTAFFQSAMGNFESRPGLVYNLGFDKFWSRDDLNDPNSFLGYLACDEFLMLNPISRWIKDNEQPFFITILCSVTHDPYEVPEWFNKPAKEPIERYKQAISYTDSFLAALDVEISKLNLEKNTILCVIGDHGEAFGEHGQLGHALIAFDEVLHIPFCLRAPFLVESANKVEEPVSSIDLTPTLLALLGFDTIDAGFDGCNILNRIPEDRKVYFSGWMTEGPAGFVQGDRKFIYNPVNKTTCVYNLSTDPLELARIELSQQKSMIFADEINTWRKNTVFRINQARTGQKVLFDSWICRWTDRISSSKITREQIKEQ